MKTERVLWVLAGLLLVAVVAGRRNRKKDQWR